MRILMVAVLLAIASPAVAQTWDSKGWVLLGETKVHGHGKLDHDRIEVGRQEGKFDKLTLVVENSDLELVDFKVVFGKGEPWQPGVTHFFREGQRTRVIEFPESAWGNTARSIKAIEFAYRNVPGEGHARVQVWGFRTQGAVAAPPPAPVWDSRGWVALGEREVHGHGRMENDRIDVGRQDGRFSKLTIVVEDADLELVAFAVRFGRNQVYQAQVNHFFKEGQRTRVIELPDSAWGSDGRAIQSIEFAYRNIPGEGHAHVKVFGFRTETAAAPPPPAAWQFESRGWVMLGEREVHGHGRENHDRVEVGRAEGKFSRLTLVVYDADLELTDLSVQFRHGDPWHAATRHFFKEGARARAIDLPASEHGGDARTIQYIDLSYRNLPGEGHARFQVWAQ
jgi:hypothetical protein